MPIRAYRSNAPRAEPTVPTYNSLRDFSESYNGRIKLAAGAAKCVAGLPASGSARRRDIPLSVVSTSHLAISRIEAITTVNRNSWR